MLNTICNFFNKFYNFSLKIFFVVGIMLICVLVVSRIYFIVRNFFLIELSVAEMRVFWHCSRSERNRVSEIINRLPYALCYHFAKNNWQLNILSAKNYSKIKANGMEKETIGLFDPRTRNIYINADVEKERTEETIYHEFGHYCDWINGGGWLIFGSSIDPFAKSIFESSRFDEAIPAYYRSDIKEFVAYCVSSYVCKPNILTSEMLELGKKRLEDVYEASNRL